MASGTVRLIEVYSKQTDAFVTEHVLQDVTATMLRDIFGDDPDDPDFVCMRRIEPKHAAAFQMLATVSFDFDRYDYFYVVRRA